MLQDIRSDWFEIISLIKLFWNYKVEFCNALVCVIDDWTKQISYNCTPCPDWQPSDCTMFLQVTCSYYIRLLEGIVWLFCWMFLRLVQHIYCTVYSASPFFMLFSTVCCWQWWWNKLCLLQQHSADDNVITWPSDFAMKALTKWIMLHHVFFVYLLTCSNTNRLLVYHLNYSQSTLSGW